VRWKIIEYRVSFRVLTNVKLLIALCFSVAVCAAQTLVVSPTGDGSYEIRRLPSGVSYMQSIGGASQVVPDPVYVAKEMTPTDRLLISMSKKKAVQEFPALAKSGSPLNLRFVALVKKYQKTAPEKLENTNWPYLFAQEAAKQL